MKKLLLLLLTGALLTLIACGDTKCTHRDADDDGKCDECSAAFEDGDEPCEHRDADDNGFCDDCFTAFEDGEEIPDGTIYSDTVYPAIIYKEGEINYASSNAFVLRDYLKEHAYFSTSVFKDSISNFRHEIALGDTNRTVSAEAKAILAEKLEAKKAELAELGEDTEFLSGYLIYSDGWSVAVVWTDFQIANVAVDYFCKNYLNDTSLVLEKGFTKSSFFSLSEYLEEREETILARKWAEFEAAVPAEYRDGIIGAYRKLYSLYDDDVVYWLASLYDTETGGFYYSESARMNEGFLPDIETTYYCLTLVGYTGMAEMFEGKWEKAIPPELLVKTSEWLKAMRDEDGYYYHPQWPKDFIEKNGYQLRISRDKGSANNLVNKISTVVSYSGYDANGEALSSTLGASTAAAVSKVILASALHSEYESTETYAAYLAKQEASLKNMSDSAKASFFYTFGSHTQSNASLLTPTMGNMFVEFCNKHQNPENGVWSENLYYNSTNAIHKIVSVYNRLGAEVKHVEKMVDSSFEILTWDPKEKPAGNTCDIYNVWSCFPYLYENIRKAYSGTAEEREAKCEEIKARVFENAAKGLEGTYEQVALCVKPGHTFSTSRGNTSKTVYGCPICPGANEGDVPGFLFASYDIPYHALLALELGQYNIPLFTEQDRYVYVNALLNAEPVEKGAYSTEKKVVYDFEDEELGSVPKNVEVELSSGGTTPNEGAYVKTVLDGESRVLEVSSKPRESITSAGRNYALALSANHTDKFPKAARLELTIKVSATTPAKQKLIYLAFRTPDGDTNVIRPYIGISADGTLTLYDSRGTKISDIGKAGEYISLAIDYDWGGGSYSFYKGDTLLGSSAATQTGMNHQMASSLYIYTDATTEASYFIDDLSFITYGK